MPAYVNPVDFVVVGIMAAVFIWGFNKILTKSQLDEYKV